MVGYRFITTWKFEAPIAKVWQAIGYLETYPVWFPYITEVSPVDEVSAATVGGAVHRVKVKTKLPYSLAFELRTVRREPPHLIEAESRGEVEGMGRWELFDDGGLTTVVFSWNVRSTKRWMNLTAPLLRRVFAWNHKKVMDAGGEQLAKHLGARLAVNDSYEETLNPERAAARRRSENGPMSE